MKKLLFLLLLCSHGLLYAQKSEVVFRSDSKKDNLYVAMLPEGKSKGLLVILPGFGGNPLAVHQETTLPDEAVKKGYTVIIPHLVDFEVVDTAHLYQQRLRSLIPEVMAKYDTPANRFIIGGHSLGGYEAMFYAEKAFEANDSSIIRPNLVFGVDPPLDLQHLWATFAYNVKINFSEVAAGEGNFMMPRFRTLYGGSPEEQPDTYRKYSSFSRDMANGGNAAFLKSVPVRLYCEPDIQWFIENRREGYEHLNASDLSACIAQLRLLGNKNAELITTTGKGYFADGRRHPHAFSILDTGDFLQWAEKMLQ